MRFCHPEVNDVMRNGLADKVYSDGQSTKLQYIASPLGALLAVHQDGTRTTRRSSKDSLRSQRHGHTRGSFLSLEPSLVEPREEPGYETI